MSMQKRRQSYPNLGPSVGSGPAPPPAPVLAVRGDMTEGEARQAVHRAKQAIEAARGVLLDLHDRKGWKALGYATWNEFVETEFGQSRRHLNRQLEAARTEQEIAQVHKEITHSDEMGPIGPISGPIRESVLRPLTGLPSPEEKHAVLVDAIDSAPGGKVTAKVVKAAVGRRGNGQQGRKKLMTERELTLGEMFRATGELLPEGWGIHLRMAKDRADVSLYDPADNFVEVNTDDQDTSEMIISHINMARKLEDLEPVEWDGSPGTPRRASDDCPY